jgi:ubiquinone/menaquinone biosynthesis C-methylase UbiE
VVQGRKTMPVHFTAAEIRAKYDRMARWYDVGEMALEWAGLRRLRRELFARVSGRVLEVAAGTGRNFAFYARGSQVTALDLSTAMLARAIPRVPNGHVAVQFAAADAQELPFPERTFDSVVSSLALCTFPEPERALAEMARVTRPEGRLFLLEHGRSDRRGVAGWQDRKAEWHARSMACHWNRDPLALAQAAGLDIVAARRKFWGIVYLIEARPARDMR